MKMNRLCGNCHRPASFVCMRCKIESYCSKNCQITAFPQHRYECFNLPALMLMDSAGQADSGLPEEYEENVAPISNVITNTAASQTSVASSMQVQQQQQPVSSKNLEEKSTDAHFQSVAAAKSKDNTLKAAPQMNDGENFLSKQSANLERDNVMKPEPAKQLQKKESKTDADGKDLKTPKILKPAFEQGPKTLPPDSYRAAEASVKSVIAASGTSKKRQFAIMTNPGKFDDDAGQEENCFTLNTFNRNQQSMFEAQQRQTSSSKQVFEEKAAKPRGIFIEDLEKRPLKAGKARVLIANAAETPNMFYVWEHNKNTQLQLSSIDELIKKDANTKAGYQPKVNEIVLAMFEGDYYRAVCTDINQNGQCDVFYIDYCNSGENVPCTEIKPLPDALKLDIFVHKVFIANLPKKLTKQIVAVMSDNEKGFIIEVKEKAQDHYVADLCDI